MNFSIHRSIFVIYLIFLILFGCGNDDGPNNTETTNFPDGGLEKFIWETTGGGDILFSISPVEDQFEIAVERYNFQTVAVPFRLTDTDAAIFNFVKDVFNQNIDLNDYTFDPQGGTGSWTEISLIYSGNREVVIENIDAANEELRALYDFVEKHTESNI